MEARRPSASVRTDASACSYRARASARCPRRSAACPSSSRASHGSAVTGAGGASANRASFGRRAFTGRLMASHSGRRPRTARRGGHRAEERAERVWSEGAWQGVSARRCGTFAHQDAEVPRDVTCHRSSHQRQPHRRRGENTRWPSVRHWARCAPCSPSRRARCTRRARRGRQRGATRRAAPEPYALHRPQHPARAGTTPAPPSWSRPRAPIRRGRTGDADATRCESAWVLREREDRRRSPLSPSPRCSRRSDRSRSESTSCRSKAPLGGTRRPWP